MSQKQFNKALNKLATIDGLLTTLGLDRSVGEVVKLNGIRGLGDYRGLLPGWGDHSEAVIAKDGSDTLSFANFNRAMELSGLVGLYIRDLARAHVAFKTDLFQLRTNVAGNLEQLRQGKVFSNTDVGRLVANPGLLAQLVTEVNKYDVNLGTAITNLSLAKSKIQGELFYFDMFGPKKQSFHKRYKYAGGRGKAGKTTVHGTPS